MRIALRRACAHPRRLAPAGQFNQSALIVRGGHVDHWLNGFKVVEFETSDAAVRKAILDLGKSGPAVSHSFLSLHGSPVWFRHLKLRVSR